jgi:hypothetical protein
MMGVGQGLEVVRARVRASPNSMQIGEELDIVGRTRGWTSKEPELKRQRPEERTD